MEPNTPVFENESQLEKYNKLSQAIHSAFQKKNTGNKLKTAAAFAGSYLGIGTVLGVVTAGSAVAGPVSLAAASMVAFKYYQSKKAKLNERESMEQKNAESAVKEGIPYQPLPVEKGLSMKQRMTQAFSKLGNKIKTEYADFFSESAIRVSEESALNAQKKPTMMERFSKVSNRVIEKSGGAIANLGDKLHGGIEFTDKKLNRMKNTITSKLDKTINEDLVNMIESATQKANKVNDRIYRGFEDSIELVGGKVEAFSEMARRAIKNTGMTIVGLNDKLNDGLYNVIQSTNKKVSDLKDTVVKSAIKLDDKLNEGLYNSIQAVNHKVDRFAEFGGRILKNSGEAIVKLDNKLNEGLYNAAQSVDGKIVLIGAALKQMREKRQLFSMSAGRSSVEDAKNIEKMASAMADLRNAFGVAGETGGKMTAFGARKLEESVTSDIERVVVGLRRNGDHKAIFNALSNHLDAISGYGYDIAEKGGLSHQETAERIKTIVDCATKLGAEPEMMWHAYRQAENKISEHDFHENDDVSSKMVM